MEFLVFVPFFPIRHYQLRVNVVIRHHKRALTLELVSVAVAESFESYRL